MSFEVERATRREIRWRILVTLNVSRPTFTSERVIHATLDDSDLPATAADVRRELDYLRDHGLVEIKGEKTSPTWSAALTGQGVDVVEYEVEAPPGVKRPKAW